MYRQVDGFNGVQRITDGAFIPADPGNRDWQDVEAWLADGNIPDPAVIPVTQRPVTVQELAAALVNKGLLSERDLKKDEVRK